MAITNTTTVKNAGLTRRPPLNDALFIGGSIAFLVVLLGVLRGILLYVNFNLATGIPSSDLVTSFLIGIRFDLIVACIAALILVPTLALPAGLGSRRLARTWLAVTGSLVLFIGVSEIEFYREFHTRLNNIAFHYLQDDPATVSSMLWNGYPVLRYVLLWLLLSACYWALLGWLNRTTAGTPGRNASAVTRVLVTLLVLFLVAWGGRGTLRSGPPLRWGDAFQSEHLLANHLGLNGTYMLVKAATSEAQGRPERKWLDKLPEQEALATVRNLLLTPADTLLEPDDYPLLRNHIPSSGLARPPKNVVLIILESFSGEFTGVMGREYGITPEFDKLARGGLLFDRVFSNGSHTHQGMFASVACFPNLPGHEYLMQQPEGQHQFSGLPALLSRRDYGDVYVYNGHFAWDNQQGFFRNQGMSHFVGRDDYLNPVFIDPTWGVSDEDMFNRSLRELNNIADKPFYAVLQTLSNHTPYALPDNLPVERVEGFGRLNDHLTAQRYSDWALGQFFDQAREQPWYDDTLFVVVGDHGFALDQQLTDIDLLRFHVPLLFIGPGIQAVYGPRNHTVASQLDIVPTAVSLLGQPFVHQCWGRDLLSLPQGDPGLAMIKPSGSDPSVAMLSGDHILVKNGTGDLQSGRYVLDPAPQFFPDDDAGLLALNSQHLSAFIESALQALLNDSTSIPGSYQ